METPPKSSVSEAFETVLLAYKLWYLFAQQQEQWNSSSCHLEGVLLAAVAHMHPGNTVKMLG